MMRRSWILPVLLASLGLAAACRRPALESRWTGQTMVADGDDSDWKDFPLQRFEKWNAAFGICNSAENLHVSMVFLEPRLAMMAGTRGLVLIFRDPDSKAPILELAYTGIDTFGSSLEPKDSFWESLNPEQRKRCLEKGMADADLITATRNQKTVRIQSDGSSGPAAARLGRRAIQGFEWKIPINGRSEKAYTLGLAPGKTVLVGVRLGNPKKDETPGMMVPGEGIRNQNPMMGTMSVSTMSGSNRPSSPESAFGNKHVYFTLTLATGP